MIGLGLTTPISSDDGLSLLLLDVRIGATPKPSALLWSQTRTVVEWIVAAYEANAEREDQNIGKGSVTKGRPFSW